MRHQDLLMMTQVYLLRHHSLSNYLIRKSYTHTKKGPVVRQVFFFYVIRNTFKNFKTKYKLKYIEVSCKIINSGVLD